MPHDCVECGFPCDCGAQAEHDCDACSSCEEDALVELGGCVEDPT